VRTHEVVALDAMSSQVNVPHEFIIAVVDNEGILHQRGGNDDVIAPTLLEILRDAHRLGEQL
jgi:hypothetical protein